MTRLDKLKDIFYNKNDILLALIILMIAGFIISGRVDAIMNYPQALAAEQDITTSGQEPEVQPDTTNATDSAIAGDGETDSTSESALQPEDNNPPEVVNLSVYIANGTTEATVAKLLLEAGLIQEKNEFLNALTVAGKIGKVQAGNFIIPSDATLEQIVDILTN